MAIVIKLRKGLDINLKGKAAIKKVKGATATEYALEPNAFPGLTPKVVVKEGEHVLAGDPLLVNKQCPDVKFASPVSGTVKAVIRGERRRVLRVVVEADKEQQARDFGKRDAGALDGQGVIDTLCEAGLLVTSISCPMRFLPHRIRSRRAFSFPHFATCLWQVTSKWSWKAMRRHSSPV